MSSEPPRYGTLATSPRAAARRPVGARPRHRQPRRDLPARRSVSGSGAACAAVLSHEVSAALLVGGRRPAASALRSWFWPERVPGSPPSVSPPPAPPPGAASSSDGSSVSVFGLRRSGLQRGGAGPCGAPGHQDGGPGSRPRRLFNRVPPRPGRGCCAKTMVLPDLPEHLFRRGLDGLVEEDPAGQGDDHGVVDRLPVGVLGCVAPPGGVGGGRPRGGFRVVLPGRVIGGAW